jgi:hypothetical protein
MTDQVGFEKDLRAASDGFLMLLEEAQIRERRKREMGPDDPRFPGLAEEIRQVAEQLLEVSIEQERLAHKAQTVGDTTAQDLPPIATIEEPEDLSAILDEWRAIDRQLATAEPASPEAIELIRRFAHMRERYARAQAARMGRKQQQQR